MCEQANPKFIFEVATAGLESEYFGRDETGTDMWEYAFKPVELGIVNSVLDEYELMPTERIVIGRSNSLSTFEDNGLLRPGEDIVSFHLEFGGLERYFSFTKTDPIHESLNSLSNLVIIDKGVFGGDLEIDLHQENQITKPEILALSAIAKLLPGNRDSA